MHAVPELPAIVSASNWRHWAWPISRQRRQRSRPTNPRRSRQSAPKNWFGSLSSNPTNFDLGSKGAGRTQRSALRPRRRRRSLSSGDGEWARLALLRRRTGCTATDEKQGIGRPGLGPNAPRYRSPAGSNQEGRRSGIRDCFRSLMNPVLQQWPAHSPARCRTGHRNRQHCWPHDPFDASTHAADGSLASGKRRRAWRSRRFVAAVQ